MSWTSTFDTAWLTAWNIHGNLALSWAAWAISNASWAGLIWWVFALILWLKGHRTLAIQIVLALLVAAVSAEAIKHLVHRLRPSEIYPQYLNTLLPNLWDNRFSFPSEHVSLSAAAAFALLFTRQRKVAWLALSFTLLVGWARICQGLHWPTDVIAGWILGAAAAGISVTATAFFKDRCRLAHTKSLDT
jgi:undecaprenyl-diphosphatase